MLYIGEKVGNVGEAGSNFPEVDIAVDPLEGTNLCATGSPGAITVLAEKGGLLHAPDCYMENIVVGPSSRGAADLDSPVKDTVGQLPNDSTATLKTWLSSFWIVPAMRS
jgi:fructose-1,6-bisphosphatase/sedoheptulose 1,7-bisphosphatase-like protein